MALPLRTLRSRGRRTSRLGRGGFTFVELVMGMTITVMIGASLAAFSLAMSKNWSESEQAQSTRLRASQASLRLMPVMQDAKITGRVRAGLLDGSAATSSATNAAVVFWAHDDNNDSIMQIHEIALIEHDTVDESLELYQVQYPSTYTSAQIAALESIVVSADDLNDSAAPETFKSVVRQVKSGYAPRPLAGGIIGARFEVRNAGSSVERPRFVYTLRLRDGDSSVTDYGTATLRGAISPDN